MRLTHSYCLWVWYLINLLDAEKSSPKVNETPGACPEEFVCACEDEYIEGYGTAVEISCKSMGLEAIPDLSSLSGIKLHKLDLSENSISALNDDDFAGIQMKSVYQHTTAEVILDGNPLSQISANAFRQIETEGIGIHISNCGLQAVPVEALLQIRHLKNLYLDNNKITSIPNYSFIGFDSLEYVDLSSNPLEVLNSDIFGGLEDTLEGVHLKNVGLDSFPAHALKRLRKLETVNLNNNAIPSLPDYLLDGFETANKFFILYLKNNGIHRVSPKAFTRSGTLLEVKALHMEENQIVDVTFLFNPCDLSFSTEADIWLENNPLHCDCGLYSATYTGFYRLEGTCAGPGDYKGVRVDVVRSRERPRRPSYEGGFGTLARSDCGSVNMTFWNMRCIHPQYTDSSKSCGRYRSYSFTLVAACVIVACFVSWHPS